MGYDKEHLRKLLEFIRMLYEDPANEEFSQGLRDLVGAVPSSAGTGKIEKIERYLALDYGLDTVDNPDYSFIVDEKVRNTLNADWREMLRYRYGLREHKVDFGEFARYADLQMEMLVNMYYADKYGSNENILNALKASFNNGYPKFLSMKCKVDGLTAELGIIPLTTFLNIIKVRNDESHRSPESLKKSLDEKYETLSELMGKPDKTDQDLIDIRKTENSIKEMMQFAGWLSTLPYEEVSAALAKLTDKIMEAMTY